MAGCYETASFQLDVPEGCVEDSIHVIRLPPGEGRADAFQPSIVVKRESASAPLDLEKRVVQQVATMAREFDDFSLVERTITVHRGLRASVLVFDWGADARSRIRQKQLLVLSADGRELHVLTASEARSRFAATEPTIDAVFASFAPRSR